MIVGTMVQTLILAYITLRCDWNEEVRYYSYNIELQNLFPFCKMKIIADSMLFVGFLDYI